MNKVDYLIIGSGLAGLFSAYESSPNGSVLVITKKALSISNSFNAQGGIAAVTDAHDDPKFHFDDTLEAGRGLCEDNAVNILVNDGPKRIKQIIEAGMKFDMENGHLSLGLEGGHHRNRILHAGGDSTGRFVTEFIIKKVLSDKNIKITEDIYVIDFLVKDGECFGVRAWNNNKNEEVLIYAEHTILASGGSSTIYRRTTNPETAMGDGVAMAYEAGCRIMDYEFEQFHPTSLYMENSSSAFLISEAVRGEGAYLLNKNNERFMVPLHELHELAPRDIVARSIFRQMIKDQMPYVRLSLKHLDKNRIRKRFPMILEKCKTAGYDLTDEIPVAPAAHYTVGGVYSNLNGHSDIKHLYVCGEVAATGVMGANRLASNSLIECLVFADRIVKDTIQQKTRLTTELEEGIFKKRYTKNPENKKLYNALKEKISDILSKKAGIIRNEDGLVEALNEINKEFDKVKDNHTEYYIDKIYKMLVVAKLILQGAEFRKESRGGHYREDYPELNDNFLLHSIQQKDKEITTKAVNDGTNEINR